MPQLTFALPLSVVCAVMPVVCAAMPVVCAADVGGMLPLMRRYAGGMSAADAPPMRRYAGGMLPPMRRRWLR